MIGIGILRTPGIVAAQLGNIWLVIAIWLIGGVYAFLSTICVTELGTMFPQAGRRRGKQRVRITNAGRKLSGLSVDKNNELRRVTPK